MKIGHCVSLVFLVPGIIPYCLFRGSCHICAAREQDRKNLL